MIDEWQSARLRHGWLVGRYVVMPDHVHFFCTPLAEMVVVAGIADPGYRSLSQFMQQWKQWTSKRIVRNCTMTPPIWQEAYFDHVLRSQESYSQKWEYVRQNPVRANLVEYAEEWEWQGEINAL